MHDDQKKISTEDQEKMLLQLYRTYGARQGLSLDTIKDNADNYQKLKDAKDMLSSQQSQERLIEEISIEMANLESDLLQFTQPCLITLSAEQQYEALLRLKEDCVASPWSDRWDADTSPYSFDEEYKKTGSEFSEMRLEAIRSSSDSILLTVALTILVLAITFFTAGIGTAAIAAGVVFGGGNILTVGLNQILGKRLVEKHNALHKIKRKIDTKLIHMIPKDHEPIHKPELNQETSPRKNFSHRTSKMSDGLPHHKKVLDILDQVEAQNEQAPQEKKSPRHKPR